jgi:hypothetical protein
VRQLTSLQKAGHPCARLGARITGGGEVRGGLDDDAGEVGADDPLRLRGDGLRRVESVDGVQGDGVHADEDLSGAGCGDGHILHGRGPGRRRQHECLHSGFFARHVYPKALPLIMKILPVVRMPSKLYMEVMIV